MSNSTGRRMCRALAALALFFCVCLHAESVVSNDRVGRIAALCKLWGAIQWFHPRLAHQGIDWDGALVRTIPSVDAATSDAEYQVAVGSLLAVLHDPATRIIAPRAAVAAQRSSPAIAPSIDWTADRIATISVPDPSYFIASAERTERLGRMFIEARTARAVILDLRGNPRVDYWNDSVLNEAFARLIGESLVMLLGEKFTEASIRYRMHSGYAPQGEDSSGGYFSALVTREGSTVGTAGSIRERRPLVVLTDADPSYLLPLLSGLQSAGLANVIYSGNLEFAGGPTVPVELPGMTALVRVGDLVNGDGSLGFRPELVLPLPQRGEAGGVMGTTASDAAMTAALTAARSGALLHKPADMVLPGVPRSDEQYRGMEYPTREYRLLSLFRFWNIIHYFYPYRHLMDVSWDELLTRYIPLVEAAKDATAYHLTIAELATHLRDSHVVTTSPVLSRYFGDHTPPLRLQFVENQTIVAALWGEASRSSPRLQMGDVVVSIDGEGVAARRERLARYQASSTPQALNSKIDRVVLAGARNSKMVLGIKDSKGRRFTVTLRRDDARAPQKQTPVYSVLNEGYGYFDLTRLTPQELEAAFRTVRDTPALILDMRGYPRGIFFALAARLALKPAVAARFERPEIHAPEFRTPVSRVFTQSVTPGSEPPYRGKVVMLINEAAISQSEHTALFVEAATDVTFIGGPTNGTDGDVTSASLPGGISVRFSGHDVRHGDGRQLQRRGIQPDIPVEPSVQGIRSGHDEVLERAIEFLQRSIT